MRNARIGRCLVRLKAAILAPALLFILASPAGAMATPRLKPPAPGPEFLTEGDYAALKTVEAAIDRRDWRAAESAASAVEDPTARSLAEWLDLYAGDDNLDFNEVGAFLDTHKNWPALAKFQIAAEHDIPDKAAPQAVIDFFKTRDPLTGEGKLALARAQFAAGNKDAAALTIREVWVNENFRLADEHDIVSHYGNLLREEDHQARVDRLLWSRDVTMARRVFSRLTPRDRRMAEARAALLVRASNASALFNALPEADRLDSGVLLAAVRYYRRGDEEPHAVELAKLAPNDPEKLRNPARWWDERQLLMRWALKEKHYADAYEMAAGGALEPGSLDFAEAQFDAGWIALRFLGAPERAEIHFKALANEVGAPISIARAYYWLGRAAEAAGHKEIAGRRYAAAAENIYTYYGQLAAERIGAPAALQTFGATITPTAEELQRFNGRPLVEAMKMLTDLRDDRALLIFSYHIDDELDSSGEYVALADLIARRGATHISIRAGKVGVGRGAFAPEVVYPLVYVPEEAEKYAPPELILGLARQESEFNPRAYSAAGARGVMQLIPSTAQTTARHNGLRYRRSALLDDPDYNMIIGSAHLADTIDRYDGSLIMALAAYNAGVNNVEEWVERYGDPRSPNVDPVDWVEQLPFAETRNYVQRVLENTEIYRGRLTKGPIAGRLSADLESGGPAKRAGLLPDAQYAEALPPVPARIVALAQARPENAAPVHSAPGAPAIETAAEAETGDDDAEAADVGEDSAESTANDLSPADEADYIGDENSRAAKTALPPPDLKPKTKEKEAIPAAAIAETPPSPSQAPSQEPVAVASNDASAPAPSLSPVNQPKGEKKDCATWRDYIEASATMGAAAADLNAGSLAQFSGDSSKCRRHGANSRPGPRATVN